MTARFALFLGLLLGLSTACGNDDAGGTAAPGGAAGAGATAGAAGVGGAAGAAGAAGSAGTSSFPTAEEILAASWQALPGAPTINGKQDDLYFITPELGWSVNGLGEIYRTEDGGATFTQLIEQPGTFFRAVVFIDAERGFVGNIGPDYFPGVTDPIPLYATSDGGVSWTPVTTITGPAPKGICNFSKLDGQHLFASGRVGGPSFFLSSADGGATWTSRDLTSQIGMLIDVHFKNPLEGFLIGGSNPVQPNVLILRTTDGGVTWTEHFKSTTVGELGWKFSFPSAEVGYASVLTNGGASSFLKTTDGGATWQQLPLIAGTYSSKGIGFITDQIGWIGGDPPSGQPGLRTADGGNSWQLVPELGPLVNRFRFVGGFTGYAIGTTVYKLDIQSAR
jgi:photosystem II stability/assembly factor-like uncharacterized protein